MSASVQNSPMAASSIAAAFELPAMPGSYEDFEFSLNLPENITASDFNLIASPEFRQLLGHSGLSAAPSMTSSAPFASSSTGFPDGSAGASSAPFSPSSMLLWKNSAPSTPRGNTTTGVSSSAAEGLDDTVMSHGTAPQLTSKPAGLDTLAAGPTPPGPPPFDPPTGGSLFSFDELAAAGQAQGQQHQQSGSVGALFDAGESNFLTNFLSGFEGWDFNPNLPSDLPSFADAEKMAYQYGTPPGSLSYGGDASRRGARQRNSGGSGTQASGSGTAGRPAGNYASPARVEASVGAAFGDPMEGWHDAEGGEEGEGMMAGGANAQPHARQMSALSTGKKMKTEHGSIDGMHHFTHNQQQHPHSFVQQQQQQQQHLHQQPHFQQQHAQQMDTSMSRDAPASDSEKRNNHILSEQRRRNHIREAFKELVDLLEAGRDFGARGLGLSSGAGTGIEDEGLDDRSDYESTLEDEEPSAATKRRKVKARRRAALEAARKAGATGHAAAAAFINGGGRGKGRGRGGSAGGGAGSKSAVLFQAVDLLHWLDGRNEVLTKHVGELEEAVVKPA